MIHSYMQNRMKGDSKIAYGMLSSHITTEVTLARLDQSFARLRSRAEFLSTETSQPKQRGKDLLLFDVCYRYHDLVDDKINRISDELYAIWENGQWKVIDPTLMQ